MVSVTLPRADIPFMTSDGRNHPEWIRAFAGLLSRAGGPTGASTDDLTTSAFEDAGVEEAKADIYALRDGFGQLPLPSIPAIEQNTGDDIASLRAEVSALRSEIEALKQGTTL
jgi:hypothetical protein